jgi:SAM-dependent methyltransferase
MDNRSFWNHRYATLPQLGSGPGSRGYAANYKNAVIRAMIEGGEIDTILDIGCGDLCWLDDQITQSCSYVGCDISEVAIDKNVAAYPSARFFVHDIVAAPVGQTADLVVCFDVLIHQIARAAFSTALTNILAAVGRIALLSYQTPPLADGRFPPPASLDLANADSGVIALEERFARMVAEELPADRPTMETAFHSALPDFVRSLRDDMEVRAIGRYRHQTIYEITRRGVDTRHR